MAIWDIKERYDLARSNSLESQATRGIFMGGFSTDESNIVDFITITSSGNAADFGDLIGNRRGLVGNADSHGGLQA